MMDWEFSAIFLALLLLEGLRRVPAGAVVLRRTGIGPWSVLLEEPGGRIHLTSLLPPFTRSLVLAPASSEPPLDRALLESRWKTARRRAPWLSLVGSMVTGGLLIGLPLAAVRLTAMGFLLTAAVVVGLTLSLALAGIGTLRAIGLTSKAAWRAGLRWFSPFAAPSVVEGVLERALRGAPPVLAAELVLSPDAFRRWVRPRAYDLVEHRTADGELAGLFDRHVLEGLVNAPPEYRDPTATTWCPRCGRSWTADGECAECGVPLKSLAVSREP